MNNQPLILVVDDEVDITETYAIYLDLQGFEVMVANDAVQALAMMALRLPDLVISDCMMPYMDGIEFSRRIRAQAASAALPVILMSGAPELHDLASPTYSLMMRKPILLPQLLAEVRRLLDLRGAL